MKRNNFILFALLLSASGFCQKKDSSKQAFSTDGKKITVYTTADSINLRLTQTDNLVFKVAKQPLETEISVFVNPDKTFQSFMGIGGAITDASAEVFAKLPKEKQQEFLNAYYDKEKGIGYSLLRTTIHSSDFSSGSYTYIKEGDKDLKSFSIDHDRKYRIPMIKAATKTAGGKIPLYVSPWSPPAFMKDNKHMLKGGKLLPEYFQSWANYYTKFINAYEKEGMPIWGITVQNEPMAVQKWESCIFTAEEERDFLKNYLGPTMAKSGYGDKKIVVWDHNRDLMFQRANVIYSDPEASKYAWGMGFHWYETWAGGEPMFDNVGKVYEAYPDKHLMFTEGCVESFDQKNYQLWANGERYGTSMINDFNNGTVAWTDWNILLDQQGGPNHVGNFCFAPIHGDTDKGELIYTPSYY
ncbi:MAG: glycosyl hydrolase, partial [Flavobacterium sp.]